MKPIHTPGPSRAVQRSVSVLGKAGRFHRDSAIWAPLQIVVGVLPHAWWGVGDGMRHTQTHKRFHGGEGCGNLKEREIKQRRNAQPAHATGLGADQTCGLRWFRLIRNFWNDELQIKFNWCMWLGQLGLALRWANGTYVKWAGLPGVMRGCWKSIPSSVFTCGCWEINHKRQYFIFFSAQTVYWHHLEVKGKCLFDNRNWVWALMFQKQTKCHQQNLKLCNFSHYFIIIVPWLMTWSGASVAAFTDADGLPSSLVPLFSMTGWTGGELLLCSPGLADKILGEALVISGEVLSLCRSMLGWWKENMWCFEGFSSRKNILISYFLVHTHLFGNERTLALWSSASLPLFLHLFTLVFCLQSPCLLWEQQHGKQKGKSTISQSVK